MSMEWSEIFKLPSAAFAGDKRISKTVLTRQAELTKREQKTLDKVARLAHFATVQKSTTHILPYVDEEHDIESIVFLRCEMVRGGEAYAEMAELLHRCFPNPTVLLMESERSCFVSAALTRKSLSERGAMVVEEECSTGNLDPNEPETAELLKRLAFEELPQRDLLAYLGEMMWRIRLARVSRKIGFYPECAERDRESLLTLIAEAERHGCKVAELTQARKDKDLSLNEQMKLRMRMKDTERKRDQAVARIKELCSERD